MTKKILLVVGARPNFMKAAPLYSALKKIDGLDIKLLHTGQHYDYQMSQIFFENLGLSKPDYFLSVQSGSHAEQTANIMVKFEKVLLEEKPDLVVVFGDVNSTVACSLVAKKMQIRLAHVEAGLRSYDDTMPEEINRRITDSISDLLFTPSSDANENLVKEGIKENRIYLVGNIMIDSLKKTINKLSSQEMEILNKFNLSRREYCLATLHRPSNVDDKDKLKEILKEVIKISELVQIVFPVHPRTKKILDSINADLGENIILIEPLGYNDFIILEKNAQLIITDSGGIQEETTYLGVPCLTLRPNTERPVTIEIGTNELVTERSMLKKTKQILDGKWKKGVVPPLWDGETASRISSVFITILKQ